MIKIPVSEFKERIIKIKEQMVKHGMDAVLVYGDEYRKENLRYVSNFWPIFERGGLLIGINDDPILLCAPEGEQVAKEMSVWPDVRLVPDFLCVTVTDEIEYPHANFTSFKKLATELHEKSKLNKLGIVGIGDMPETLLNGIRAAFGCEVVDAGFIIYDMRLRKSENEIACLREAARIAEVGFKAMMDADVIGKTELYAAGIAEGTARKEGAEHIIFTVFGSGDRSAKIIGRPTLKVIEDGDMIMCSMAVQYEGYVATFEIPYAVGNVSDKTKRVINVLFAANEAGKPYLKAGVPMKDFVKAVRDVFRNEGLAEYDVYPPLHGSGCAEAENPYPNENTEVVFEAGMTVNTDISLFGLEGGSNRIEEGFIIHEDRTESICPYISEFYENWKKK